MKKIAQFLKVSEAQFREDWTKNRPDMSVPTEIRLPKRATVGSAGYDFFAPEAFELQPGESTLIPTGTRVRIDEGWVLQIYPRSGLGFKYGVRLMNTVGIIDSDYFNAKNEGHIMIKLVNESPDGKTLEVKKGDAFAQGLFVQYGICVDDETDGVREGGFGSTDHQ